MSYSDRELKPNFFMLSLLFSFEHLQSFRQTNQIFYFSTRTNTFTGARRWAKS